MTTQVQDDWVARVLGVGGVGQIGDRDEPLDLAAIGLEPSDIWQDAIETFQAAVETVDVQISALQTTLRETDDPDLHEIADFGLNAITGNTRVPLMAAIREAGLGTAVQLTTAAPKLTKAIEAFRLNLASEPRVAACDNNPFDVTVSIAAIYEEALSRMEDALRRAA